MDHKPASQFSQWLREMDGFQIFLCAIAIGVGREKHLQQVLFSENKFGPDLGKALTKWSPRAFAEGVLVVPTTKGS